MKTGVQTMLMGTWVMGLAGPALLPAADTVATAVYARVGNGYSRQKAGDGSFKPEYYALSNGGRIAGTTADLTVDRVTYPQVAEIAMRLLKGQNYHYAQNNGQATLLLVLNWGNTTIYNRVNYEEAIKRGGTDIENQLRDQINDDNARILGYMDELAAANDIRRWAGGGDNYADLISDVEETRYYIMISAYDFQELVKHGRRTLLWQVRVSVRTAGNSFDDSVLPMLKSAGRYFGQDSGRLVRTEDPKGTVELGDLKFMGEAQMLGRPPAKENK